MKLLAVLFAVLLGCAEGNIVVYEATDGEIAVRTSSRYAGAIESLTWRGKEFICALDHGRGLQTACHFDGLGECYNPTEAGSERDGPDRQSSSVLLAVEAFGPTLRTQTQMAFWAHPGRTIWCGPVRNTTVLSDFVLHKNVTIESNIVTIDLHYMVPRDYESGVFEVLTGYMPPEFSRQESALPMFSDGYHTMAAYCPGLAEYSTSFFDDQRVGKWNAVWRTDSVKAGAYAFRCYVAVGALDTVREIVERWRAR